MIKCNFADRTYESVEQIARWKDERNVSYHVDHASHVNWKTGHVVIDHYDVRDDAVLDPLHRVAGAVQHEDH